MKPKTLDQRKFSVQNFRVTDIQQLFNHHSSYTTHQTPLIIHHSSYTTHHTPLIIHHSSYTTHHTPLIIHHSSYTTHHTPLIIHHSSYTTHHTPLIIHHSSYTTHHTPLIIHYSSYTTRHTPLIIHYSSYTTHHTRLITHHSSYTTHHTPLKLQATPAPGADFVAGAALCEPPCADFVDKMGCGEIAKARNAVFFNGTGGSEAGKSRSAEHFATVARRSRAMLGSCSDHARNRPSIGIRVFTCFLKCRFRGRCSTL